MFTKVYSRNPDSWYNRSSSNFLLSQNPAYKKYFRDYSKFNKDLYLDDIKLIDWHEILNPEKNLNEKVQEAINTLNKIVDKYAPLKLASQSKQRQLNKPWLTKGILKSVKRKQKMYRTHFLSEDLQKIGEYKHYAAFLSHLKTESKTKYYNMQF